MGTQALGDVNLITKQEVEAMLDAVVVPEDKIDSKILAEKQARETTEKVLAAAIDAEKQARENTEKALDDKITAEKQVRDERDKGLDERIDQEHLDREQAESEIVERINSFREYQSETYPNAFIEKIKGLPIAFITVTNDDKSLHIGDTIATIDEAYFPKRAVDFVMYSEQLTDTGASKTVLLVLRLDNNGNVNVINMADVALATSATDTATVVYLTEV